MTVDGIVVDADAEAGTGEAPGAGVAGDADGEGAAVDAPGDGAAGGADGEGAAGGVTIDGVAGVWQVMVRFMVLLVREGDAGDATL